VVGSKRSKGSTDFSSTKEDTGVKYAEIRLAE